MFVYFLSATAPLSLNFELCFDVVCVKVLFGLKVSEGRRFPTDDLSHVTSAAAAVADFCPTCVEMNVQISTKVLKCVCVCGCVCVCVCAVVVCVGIY